MKILGSIAAGMGASRHEGAGASVCRVLIVLYSIWTGLAGVLCVEQGPGWAVVGAGTLAVVLICAIELGTADR